MVDIAGAHIIDFSKLCGRNVVEETATPYVDFEVVPLPGLDESLVDKGIEHLVDILVIIVAAGDSRKGLTEHLTVFAGLIFLIGAVVPLFETDNGAGALRSERTMSA